MKKVRIPFDLTEYKKGGYKVYDNKGEVSIIKTDVKINNDICKKYPIVGISICDEVPYANFYTEDGTCLVGEEYNELVLVKNEFEYGDIITTHGDVINFIIPYRGTDNNGGVLTEAHYNRISKKIIISSIPETGYGYTEDYHLATEDEKKIFFDALAKIGKHWNSEKKCIEDIKPKCTLQPFDKVLVRDSDIFEWECGLFSNLDKDDDTAPYMCIGNRYFQCIPYNEETKHILGTTDDAPEKYKTW